MLDSKGRKEGAKNKFYNFCNESTSKLLSQFATDLFFIFSLLINVLFHEDNIPNLP
jgi:hypothetical protein